MVKKGFSPIHTHKLPVLRVPEPMIKRRDDGEMKEELNLTNEKLSQVKLNEHEQIRNPTERKWRNCFCYFKAGKKPIREIFKIYIIQLPKIQVSFDNHFRRFQG